MAYLTTEMMDSPRTAALGHILRGRGSIASDVDVEEVAAAVPYSKVVETRHPPAKVTTYRERAASRGGFRGCSEGVRVSLKEGMERGPWGCLCLQGDTKGGVGVVAC